MRFLIFYVLRHILKIVLQPGETQVLEVFAFPQVVGKYSETLVYSILNNPEPGFIKVNIF